MATSIDLLDIAESAFAAIAFDVSMTMAEARAMASRMHAILKTTPRIQPRTKDDDDMRKLATMDGH